MSYPTGPRRYRLVRLRDGRIHATDNQNPRVCYLLTPRRPGRPAYGLASAGEIRVVSGRLTDVSERAESSGYRFGRGFTGDISLTRLDDPRWQLSYS
ncbi:MAG TPA: hypothetical protein VE173_05995, partial [Longimicrobiales bacterium]|nr:hypothetical protein [Longimicrobiales bacterium]